MFIRKGNQYLVYTLWSTPPSGHAGNYVIDWAPDTPSHVSTALAQSCLIFQSAARSQENPDIFREKGPVTASLQQPWRFYEARMAFYHVPTEFFLAILCALTTPSRHFHGAHNASTVLSRCVHCADGMFKIRRHLKDLRTISVKTPRTTIEFAHNPFARPWSSYCVLGDLTAWLWQPHYTLFECCGNAEPWCLFWACSKYAPSFGVLCDSTASTGDATVLLWRCLSIVLRAPHHSTFFLDALGLPWECCSGVTGFIPPLVSVTIPLNSLVMPSRLLISSAEMFKKPLWQTVWTQIRLLL